MVKQVIKVNVMYATSNTTVTSKYMVFYAV